MSFRKRPSLEANESSLTSGIPPLRPPDKAGLRGLPLVHSFICISRYGNVFSKT